MKLGIKRVVEVDAKVLKVHAKTRDCCSVSMTTADGDVLHEHDGYTPGFFPGDHCGDYLILDIDIETGRILNWKTPTAEVLREWMEGGDE